jgi:hypothetical protein
VSLLFGCVCAQQTLCLCTANSLLHLTPTCIRGCCPARAAKGSPSLVDASKNTAKVLPVTSQDLVHFHGPKPHGEGALALLPAYCCSLHWPQVGPLILVLSNFHSRPLLCAGGKGRDGCAVRVQDGIHGRKGCVSGQQRQTACNRMGAHCRDTTLPEQEQASADRCPLTKNVSKNCLVRLDGRDERDGLLGVRDGVGDHGRDSFAHGVDRAHNLMQLCSRTSECA